MFVGRVLDCGFPFFVFVFPGGVPSAGEVLGLASLGNMLTRPWYDAQGELQATLIHDANLEHESVVNLSVIKKKKLCLAARGIYRKRKMLGMSAGYELTSPADLPNTARWS